MQESNKLIESLIEVLEEQKEIFGSIIELEDKKSFAITTHNAEELKTISLKQESILTVLETIEQKRLLILEQLSKETGHQLPKKIAEIFNWPEIKKEQRELVERKAEIVVETIIKMQLIVQLNQNMLEANNDLVQTYLQSITQEPQVGYQANNQKRKSVLLDLNC